MAQQFTMVGDGQPGTPQVIAVGVPQAVDPLYQAARIALRPLDYTGVGGVLGHYAVAQKSGNTVSLAAGAHVGRVRWAPTAGANNSYAVLMRLKVGWTVQAAVTAAVQMDFDAIIARGFTTDYSSNITLANMAAVPRTNAMRSGQGPTAMATSQMGVNGPGICTTAAISGQTATLDSNPFAITTFANQPSGNATVTQAIGVGAPMQTLYEWTGIGQHPVVLSMNEGVVVRESTAGVVTGAVQIYLQWEWAEVFVF